MPINSSHDTPHGISATDEPDVGLMISRQWISPRHVIAQVVAVLLLARAYFAASAAPHKFGPFVEQLLQPSALTIVSVVLFYYGLVGIINRTTIRLQKDGLEISHGPLPAPGRRRVRRPAVRAVEYDEEAFTTGRSGGRDQIVRAILIDGTKIVVDRVRDGEEQAKWLYRRIKRHLDERDSDADQP